MTDCIYTGAYIQCTNYGAYFPADIYRAGESLVLRINPEQHWTYVEDFPVTHLLTLPTRESQFYWPDYRNEHFTAVVPLDAIQRTAEARKPDLPEIS